MTIQDFKYIIAIAKHAHITNASYELYVSESALSKRLAAVERELGTSLFLRSRNKMKLTPAGLDFVRYAQTIVDEYSQLCLSMERHKHAAASMIRLGTYHHLLCVDLSPTIDAFSKLHPDVHIQIFSRATSELLHLLENDMLDLAFIVQYELGLKPQEYNIYAIPKMDDELAFVTQLSHPWAHRESVNLEDMANEPLILLSKSTPDRKVVMNAFKSLNITPNVVQDANRLDVIFDYVSCNYASALISSKLADIYCDKLPNIVKIPARPILPRITRLVVSKENEKKPGVRTFVQYVSETLGATLLADLA